MQWLPLQCGRYIISPLATWMFRIAITLVSAFAFIGGINMFENIPEIYITIAMCAIAMVAWVGIIQYSKFEQHIKKNIGTEKEDPARKFAVIPYFVIPVLFGAISVIVALFVTNWVIGRGYVATEEDIAIVAIVATIVANCVLDKALVSHIGDTVYFKTIEDKVAQVAEEFPKISKEDMEILNAIKKLKG